MNRLFWNLIIALVWVTVTGQTTGLGFVIGFLVGAVLLVLLEPRKIRRGYGRKLVLGTGFALFYIAELTLSNLRVARDVLSPRPGRHPAIVAVHLEEGHTDGSITLLGNLITMTPGTMSLDVSPDRRWLYIHAMFVEDIDKFRDQFKNDFERRVLGLFR